MQWSDHPMGNCERCYYFTPRSYDGKDDVGSCHRYPEVAIKTRQDYCGEFVSDPSRDPIRRNANNYL